MNHPIFTNPPETDLNPKKHWGWFIFLFIIAVLGFMLLSGCVGEKVSFPAGATTFEDYKKTQDQRWEMYLEREGLVEWTERFFIVEEMKIKIPFYVIDSFNHFTEDNGFFIETYLTSDPIKVEWVELGCENVDMIDENTIIINNALNRCKELKQQIYE